ncbi:uncharacterized protein LTR77_003913 [Saxophila tyrrhenica]|uniref:Serine carboxypeptidase n=1 Tax=Saxophila tyrrhenica TaxID=1690608 RepID=A0AAV9PEZ2_9PEZI|nr:hypothetical protein LTR77_003913 [Saxophila tyrrhenica]
MAALFGEAVPAILSPRNPPQAPRNVSTIFTPSGAQIRYKEPGKAGVCETTPGVNSYSGYIDLSDDVHVFFWMFEARKDPANAPVTLWLNGGPGSDSLIGLFEEIGPCHITKNLTSQLRDIAWSNEANLLFLSQPVGTGFSYSDDEVGYLDPTYLTVKHPKPGQETGRWSVIDPTVNDTTTLAAHVCWELLQGFYSGLPQMASDVESTAFSLWSESFGGHWGPAFMSYFYEQNQKISEQNATGRKLDFKSFGLVNAIADERIQTKYLLEFTQSHTNTYGLDMLNETVYDHGRFNMYRPGGCQDAQDYCASFEKDSLVRRSQCSLAQFLCQNSVENLFYNLGGGRGTYDIWRDYINTAEVQNALGTSLNYTSSNLIYSAFSLSGDFAVSYLYGIEELLKHDIQVEKIFPFPQTGLVKKPSEFQPEAAFAIFNRSLHGLDVATGMEDTTGGSKYSTKGTNRTTHFRQAPPLNCSSAA